MRRLLLRSLHRAFGRGGKKPSLREARPKEGGPVTQADLERLIEGTGIETLVEGHAAPPRDTGTRLLDLLERVDEKQCRGCGAKFQFEDKRREGYIELARVKSAAGEVEVREVLQQLLGSGSQARGEAEEGPAEESPGQMYSVEQYEEDPLTLESVEQVEQLFEEKVVKKELCDRCVYINEGNYERLKDIQTNIESTLG